jgi:DNA-binding NtrC family response regulator
LRLLIVDDEEAARYGMRRALETFGCEIAEAESAEAARALLRNSTFDLLLLDVNLPGMSGLEFLTELRGAGVTAEADTPQVIIITAHGSERLAVQAVKNGAYDYLSKPFEVDELRLVVKNAFENIELRRENRSLRRRIEIETSQSGALLGNSAAMQRARDDREGCHTDARPIRGESGTGKELVGQAARPGVRRDSGALWPSIARRCRRTN